MIAGKKFAVIGSNSFSGAHFVAHLLDHGASVVGISRSEELAPVFLPYKWKNHQGFEFHQLDLNHDLAQIMKVMDDFKPAYVVNFTAQGMVAQSWEKPSDWFMTNLVSMVAFHDELRKRNYVTKFIHASTPEVYGNMEGLVQESTVYRPSTPYAISKAACDMSLMAFKSVYGFPVVLTRSANVCGPGQQLYRIIPKAILCALTGTKLILDGGGTSVRSFIHMKDVCRGTLAAVLKGTPGDIFHFSTTSPISIRDLVEKIAHKVRVKFNDLVEIVRERKGKDAAYLLDSTHAAEKLDWQPQISLDVIIDETIEWMKKNLEELKKQPTSYIHKS